MGCYTSIYKDKIEYQIYGGDDTCETYNLGDKVNFRIIQNSYKQGHLLDGIYEAYTYDKNYNYYIIIEQAVITNVEKIRKQHEDEDDDSFEVFFEQEYINLKFKYSFKEYPDSLWSKKSKIEHEQRILDNERDINKYFETMKDLPSTEKLAKFLTYPLTNKLNYDDVSKNAFIIESIDLKDK